MIIALLLALAMRLDQHTVGYLTYNVGLHSSMNTTIVRQTVHSYTAFAIQFGILNSFLSLDYTYKMPERKLELRGSIKLVTWTL